MKVLVMNNLIAVIKKELKICGGVRLIKFGDRETKKKSFTKLNNLHKFFKFIEITSFNQMLFQIKKDIKVMMMMMMMLI